MICLFTTKHERKSNATDAVQGDRSMALSRLSTTDWVQETDGKRHADILYDRM